jgi:sigma-B regulation protein RsbQ
MAPAIMGVPDQPHLRAELSDSFCRNDPEIARHYAQVTFLSDHRADVAKSHTPALILQCSEDLIAPLQVGKFMHENMPGSVLCIINNVGHCPHMSAATASYEAMDLFLSQALD